MDKNESLEIRLIDLKDSERVFYLIDNSREHLRKWLPWLDETVEVKNTEEYIKLSIKAKEQNLGLQLVIMNSEIVGIVGFNLIDWPNKTGYVGYWLGEEYQGNGIMLHVVKSLVTYAFDERKLNRIDIRIAVENMKSRAIPEQLGFINKGRIR
ncbi:ribosomal-protein-serine acetyltransferase [Paenibacillus phyllosphaerae]|uniref:Ribosomal-protein-serine acetyltransferase n=1 Tax=Paenibacillus phyllosphaerae TaxID=274593 RepID=A0A7W5B0E0_9BACL|nr:ribosomal-protein-serine acetyltransferase [Paenibacillus phyllosphaerae]